VRLIELTHVKGGTIWINPGQLLYVCLTGDGGGSMYGDNNVATSTKLHFVHGFSIDVKETLAEVVARIDPRDAIAEANRA
jgi:hypothetical protein